MLIQKGFFCKSIRLWVLDCQPRKSPIIVYPGVSLRQLKASSHFLWISHHWSLLYYFLVHFFFFLLYKCRHWSNWKVATFDRTQKAPLCKSKVIPTQLRRLLSSQCVKVRWATILLLGSFGPRAEKEVVIIIVIFMMKMFPETSGGCFTLVTGNVEPRRIRCRSSLSPIGSLLWGTYSSPLPTIINWKKTRVLEA